jgi:hypothetical protein
VSRAYESLRKTKLASGKRIEGYAGMGIAVLSLLDSTVMVTIRQSDSEAIASEAATASLSRGDATAIAGLVKPAAPDRVMGPNP